MQFKHYYAWHHLKIHTLQPFWFLFLTSQNRFSWKSWSFLPLFHLFWWFLTDFPLRQLICGKVSIIHEEETCFTAQNSPGFSNWYWCSMVLIKTVLYTPDWYYSSPSKTLLIFSIWASSWENLSSGFLTRLTQSSLLRGGSRIFGSGVQISWGGVRFVQFDQSFLKFLMKMKYIRLKRGFVWTPRTPSGSATAAQLMRLARVLKFQL